MKYARILRAILGTAWAMHPDKLNAMMDILRFHMEGGKLSSDEIQARLTPAQDRKIAEKQGDIMVLPLIGVISHRAYMVEDVSTERGTSTEIFSRQFRAALNDPNIKAIILDINSPGGSVFGVEELAAEIFAARGVKPVIAQVNAYAASAAYWIACSAEEIVVTHSGEVGSIGVWSMHEDWSKALEMEGVNPTLISAGKYKVEGNPFGPLSEEAAAAMPADVDACYEMFVKAVARGRGVDVKQVKEGFGEGRMVLAAQAVKMGMADRIGTMRETLSRLGVGNAAPVSQNKKSAPLRAAARARDIEILKIKK